MMDMDRAPVSVMLPDMLMETDMLMCVSATRGNVTGLAVLLVLMGMAESYMTNYVCNTSYELVEKQNLSRTAEPGKVLKDFFSLPVSYIQL